jgi:predicted ATPase
MAKLPCGTVTFLFTDIEGSTRLLQALGDDYAEALAQHRRALRQACTRHGGVEMGTEGDALFVAFAKASDALAAAAEGRDALASGPIKVRMGLHTGEPLLTDEGYVGMDVHRAARIAAAGHGGQILVSQATRDLVGGEGLHELGEHRLKDLTAPERIYQLGEGDFPPLKSLYQTNLPEPATPFLGRDRELQEVCALLAESEVRLLTLTGAGGMGKTRLAAQAAADVSELYPDGVFWVGLASLHDSALVLPTIAQVLGEKENVAKHIGSKRLLLLLDNFEHVVEAATGLAGLLSGCPNLVLLVTSREPLHLASEREYAVLPLRESDAVSLFHERVQATGTEVAGDDEVTEICGRLDHLPLAIELAAAQVKVLPPRMLLERLEQRLPLLTGGARDLPERQRTLSATIEWSYDLLGPKEQRLFARLAVFAGGCTLEAAEEVCEASVGVLHSLIDKSLLRRAGNRYWMLETIREYAANVLEASAESEALRSQHLQFLTALAEEAHRGLRGASRTEWIERIREDIDNARAALSWEPRTTASGELQLRLAAALRLYWDAVGSVGEGRGWIENGLSRVRDPSAQIRYDAYTGAAAFASQQRDFAKAFEYDAEALAAAHELDDGRLVATALMRTAIDYRLTGDLPRARELYEEALSLADDAGDDHLTGAITHNLGDLALYEGDFERARALFKRALEGARVRADPQETAYALCNLALASFDLDGARVFGWLQEALTIVSNLSWPLGLAYTLELTGDALAAWGDAEGAGRLLAAAEAMREELELPLDPFEQSLHDESLVLVETALGRAHHAVVADEGRGMSEVEAIGYALSRLNTAELSVEPG